MSSAKWRPFCLGLNMLSSPCNVVAALPYVVMYGGIVCIAGFSYPLMLRDTNGVLDYNVIKPSGQIPIIIITKKVISIMVSWDLSIRINHILAELF